MDIQACIPAALAAVHNFIRIHEADDEEIVWLGGDDPRSAGVHDDDEDEHYPIWDDEEPSQRRDDIASGMWAEYQTELAKHTAAAAATGG